MPGKEKNLYTWYLVRGEKSVEELCRCAAAGIYLVHVVMLFVLVKMFISILRKPAYLLFSKGRELS